MATIKYKTHKHSGIVTLDSDLAKLYVDITKRVWKHQRQFEAKFDNKSTINDWFSFIVGLLTQMIKKPWDDDRFQQGALGAAAVLIAMLLHYKRNGTFAPRHYDEVDVLEESEVVKAKLYRLKDHQQQAKRDRFLDKLMERSEDCPQCDLARMLCTDNNMEKVDCKCGAVFYPIETDDDITVIKNPVFCCPKHGINPGITYTVGEKAKCTECGQQITISMCEEIKETETERNLIFSCPYHGLANGAICVANGVLRCDECGTELTIKESDV